VSDSEGRRDASFGLDVSVALSSLSLRRVGEKVNFFCLLMAVKADMVEEGSRKRGKEREGRGLQC